MEQQGRSEYNEKLQKIRGTEFPQLLNTTYLDHAGTTLYATSLIDSIAADLISNLYGNPHSASPASHLSTVCVDNARAAVLNYFNASQQDFEVVFVANATAAIKLVAQSFAQQGFDYAYHRDGHTSLVGVRELASSTRYFEADGQVEQWIKDGASFVTSDGSAAKPRLQLFGYPAQSNMNGHRPSLKWCGGIRAVNPNMYTLLDAASYLTTGRLDLSEPSTAPDYIALSFYKIFGFPDLGALIIRKPAAAVLTSRTYFGGGTVDMVIATTCEPEVWHASKSHSIYEQLEDGTLPFHSILTLNHALKFHQQLFGSAQSIRAHVGTLALWLYDELTQLRHYNGSPVVELYTDANSTYSDASTQGPIVTFNLLSSEGRYIGKSVVEAAAIACGIQLRTGGVCNPGGIATSLHLQPWEMRRNFAEGMRCGDDLDVLGGKPTGIVRVSLGPMSTMVDVMVFKEFVQEWFLESSRPLHDTRSFATSIGLETNRQRCISQLSGHQEPIFVTPIAGVKPSQLITSPSRSCHLTADAVASWQHEWVIVHMEKMQALPLQTITSAELSATIWPEKGQLIIQSSRVDDELCIGLWTLPTSSDKTGLALMTTPSSNDSTTTVQTLQGVRTADLYQCVKISSFLTVALDGCKCTLARFRSRYANDVPAAIGLETTVSETVRDPPQYEPNSNTLKSENPSFPSRRNSVVPETLKCVHVNCNYHFELSCSKAEMQRRQRIHFAGHARDFERMLRAKGLGRPNLDLSSKEKGEEHNTSNGGDTALTKQMATSARTRNSTGSVQSLQSFPYVKDTKLNGRSSIICDQKQQQNTNSNTNAGTNSQTKRKLKTVSRLKQFFC